MYCYFCFVLLSYDCSYCYLYVYQPIPHRLEKKDAELILAISVPIIIMCTGIFIISYLVSFLVIGTPPRGSVGARISCPLFFSKSDTHREWLTPEHCRNSRAHGWPPDTKSVSPGVRTHTPFLISCIIIFVFSLFIPSPSHCQSQIYDRLKASAYFLMPARAAWCRSCRVTDAPFGREGRGAGLWWEGYLLG